MGCKNSTEMDMGVVECVEIIEILEVVNISIEVVQNSILNTSNCECNYEFCDICMSYKMNNIIHCSRCDECHDNRKTLFCEFCTTCINWSSEIDIMNHRRRHNICKLFRERNQSI